MMKILPYIVFRKFYYFLYHLSVIDILNWSIGSPKLIFVWISNWPSIIYWKDLYFLFKIFLNWLFTANLIHFHFSLCCLLKMLWWCPELSKHQMWHIFPLWPWPCLIFFYHLMVSVIGSLNLFFFSFIFQDRVCLGFSYFFLYCPLSGVHLLPPGSLLQVSFCFCFQALYPS